MFLRCGENRHHPLAYHSKTAKAKFGAAHSQCVDVQERSYEGEGRGQVGAPFQFQVLKRSLKEEV